MDGDFYERISKHFDKHLKIPLPHIPATDSVDAWTNYGVELLQCLSFISTKCRRWFAWFVYPLQGGTVEEREKEFICAKATYDALERYFFECSHCARWLKRIHEYERKGKNEINPYDKDARQVKFNRDVAQGKDVRRSTFASHVMWELCQLRVIVSAAKMRGKTRFACAHHFPTLMESGFARGFEGPILRYTQYQLRTCLFKICRRLESRCFSQELNAYLNLLLDRGCAFFCCYFNDGSIDVASMRQRALTPPLYTNQADDDKRGTTDLLLNVKRSEVTQESQRTHEYYSISFEFVYFWQLYYTDILTRIKTLLDRPMLAHGKFFRWRFANRSWIGGQITWQTLRKACIDKSYRVASELREEYEKKYIKTYVHPVEKTLFLKDNAAYSEKTKDLRMIEKLFPSQYEAYLKKSKRNINEVIMQDELDDNECAAYEWIALKLIDGLFGVKVGFFNQYVYDRERLLAEMDKVACLTGPIVVQCHTRYFVYFQKTLFVDDQTVASLKTANENYIVDAEKTLRSATLPEAVIDWDSSGGGGGNYQSLCSCKGNVRKVVPTSLTHHSELDYHTITSNDSINIYMVVELWIHFIMHYFQKDAVAPYLAEALRTIKEKTIMTTFASTNTTLNKESSKLTFR